MDTLKRKRLKLKTSDAGIAKMPRKPVIRTPFTDRDKALIRGLDGAKGMMPGAKRLVRTLNDDLKHREMFGMTDAQRVWVADLAYRYRRQMPKALQQPTRPSIEETEFYTEFYAAFDEESHLEPTEADLEEMRDWANALRKPDNSIAPSFKFQSAGDD